MKLYHTQNGRWVGTQADAKIDGPNWKAVEVPTDKPSLIEWLNANSLNIDVAYGASQSRTEAATTLHKPHAWQTIRECAERAPLKDLGAALAVAMNRLDEIADRNG